MSKVDNSTLGAKTAKLDELVAWFDSDDFELEQALDKFTEAKKLADEIEKDLMSLKNTITVVGEQFDREQV
jgi:exodeoxyribonuclease VII small subunit